MSSNFIAIKAQVDFPDPDSPTKPKTFLDSRENETLSTATKLSSLFDKKFVIFFVSE